MDPFGQNKPYTEIPNMDGEPDEKVAAHMWELHLKRNDSIITGRGGTFSNDISFSRSNSNRTYRDEKQL